MTEKKFEHTRAEVLEKLWGIAQWHEEKRLGRRTRLDPNLRARSALAAKEIRAYQAILQGLTDEELELRVMQLETQLKNSVLIPKPEEQKR